MKPLPQISEAELEVMKVLWEAGEATSSEIVGKLEPTTEWKPKTIQTLITRLVAKEAVKSEKITGKIFKYSPCITEREYKSQANESFLSKVYNGSMKLMMMNFIKDNKLSKRDIEELRQMLDEKEEG